MNCLVDYIGIKGCGAAPASGLYINQLPGLTLDSIEKIANSEQVSFLGVWKEVQARAVRKFQKDYLRLFHTKWVGFCCDEKDCDPVCIACKCKDLMVDAWMYLLGTELMIERMYSSRINRYTTINKKDAEELRDHYEVEYEKALDYAVGNIPKKYIEACFECKSSIQRVEALP